MRILSREELATLLLSSALVLGCGDDDGGTLDAAAPDAATACLNVRLGSGGGDGSEALPFGSLDEALAVAAAGDTICLAAGEHVPPTAPITTPVTIRGAGDEAPDGSVITAALGSCQTVSLRNQVDPDLGEADAAVVVVADAPVDLQDLIVQGCDVGIAIRGADADLERVWVTNVVSTVHIQGGALTVTDAFLEPASRTPLPDTVGPIGAFAFDGSLQVRGSRVEGAGLSRGLTAWASDLDTEDTVLEGGLAGLVADGGASATASVRIGPGTEVTGLRTELGIDPRNVLARVSVSVEALTTTNSEGVALALREVTNASLSDLSLVGEYGLFLVDSPGATLGGTSTMNATSSALAMVGGDTDSGLTLTGALTSTGAMGGHVVLIGETGAATLAGDGVMTLNGGDAGLLVSGAGGMVDLTAMTFAATVPGAALATLDQAMLVAGVGVTIDGGSIGVLVGSEGTAIVTGATIDGARVGVGVNAGTLTMDLTTIRNSALTGVVHYGSASTITGGSIEDGGGAGVIADGDLTIDGTTIQRHAGRGVEVGEGATLVLQNANLRENVGSAVAFYDAEGTITNTAFGGTLPDGGGRADEVRLIGTGTTRNVTVSANNFDLDVTRTCTGDCSIFLASGPGAAGIVMPNCLVAAPGEGSTRTLVDQDGGAFTVSGDATWTTLLAGPASDLGLSTGSALARPAVMGTVPAIPPGLGDVP